MTEAGPYHFLVREAAVPRGSVTQTVTAALREAIVTLALKPGEILDKGVICKRLGVSRFPVSEALGRLSSEGLVDILPQRGSAVSRVKIAEVTEYMLIRKALEAEAVRVLALDPPPSLLQALLANLSGQHSAAAHNNRPGFHELDLQFHDLLAGAVGSGRLKSVIDGARANLDRARRLLITPRRHAVSLAEHEAIFAGLQGRDPARAMQAMRAHIDSVVGELLGFARQHPELFADGEQTEGQAAPSFPFG